MSSNGKGPLYSWLRRQPQPSMLRIDGKTVTIGKGSNKWARLLETVESMQPERIEALDADGNIIRATGCDLEGEAPTNQGALSAASAEQHRDVQLARIILEATDAGARRHSEAYTLAFAENTKLVQILAERLGGLERAWQESLANRAAELANNVAASGEAPDAAGAAIVSLIGQAVSGGGKVPAKGK